MPYTYSWSNNPAYVLLDLLTNPRYGCGARSWTTVGPDPENQSQPGIDLRKDVDLASFLVAARYCEDNNIEFNAYINRKSDASNMVVIILCRQLEN